MSAPPPEFDPSPLEFRIQPVYQPIVSLQTRTVVGFEALARPHGESPWVDPEQMFQAAEQRRETAEFDWRCRLAAVAGALHANLPSELALFVNAEPSALDTAPPRDAADLLVQARGVSIIVEITERHLMHDPAGLLRAVEHARGLGWRIAVDDVGSDSSSLALLALLRPDVVKLDRSLVHERSSDRTAAVLAAVKAESGRTGALILAEGIENERDEQWARDVGADWVQGWFYGAPAGLPSFGPDRRTAPVLLREPTVTVRAPAAVTPYGLTHSLGRPHRVDDGRLDALELELLSRAASLGPTSLVLASVPTTTTMTAARLGLFRDLASRNALTAVLGSAAPAGDRAGVRWVEVGEEEPLALERSVIVLDPLFHAALISVCRGVDAAGVPEFDYRMSFDHNLVLDAATLLMRRIPSLSVSASVSAES